MLDVLAHRGVGPARVAFVVAPTVPGRGAHNIASADDVTVATAGALRDAGLNDAAVVALTAAARPNDLEGWLLAGNNHPGK